MSVVEDDSLDQSRRGSSMTINKHIIQMDPNAYGSADKRHISVELSNQTERKEDYATE